MDRKELNLIMGMLSGLLLSLIEWLLGLAIDGMSQLLETFGEEFAKNFSNFELFEKYFANSNWLNTMEETLGWISFTFTILLVMFGLVRNIFSGLGFFGENPFAIIVRTIIAAALAFRFTEILRWIYGAIFAPLFDVINGGFDSLGKASTDLHLDFMHVDASIITILAELFFLIILIKKVLEVIVEFFERYLLLAFLVFVSPIVSCAVTLKTTMKVFSSFIKMFFGQALMLLISSVSLQMMILCMRNMVSVLSEMNTGDFITRMLPFFVTYAFLRIISRVDNYMRDIGLSVGVTGGDLFTDLRSAALMAGSAARNIGGAIAGGARFGAGVAAALRNGGGTNVANAAARTMDKAAGVGFGAAMTNNMQAALNNVEGKGPQSVGKGVKNAFSNAFGVGKPGPIAGQGFDFKTATSGAIKAIKNADGSTTFMQELTDKNGNTKLASTMIGGKGFAGVGTSTTTLPNGEKMSTKIHDSKDMDARALYDSAPMADTVNPSELSNSSLSRDDNIAATNNGNLATQLDSLGVDGVNVGDFSETAPSGTAMTPENYTAASEISAAKASAEGVSLDGSTPSVTSGDIDFANAAHSAGVPVDADSYSAYKDLQANNIPVSPENISVASEGAGYGLTASESIAAANMGSSYGINSQEAMSYAKEYAAGGDMAASMQAGIMASNGLDPSNTEMFNEVSQLGSNYGYSPKESVEYVSSATQHNYGKTYGDVFNLTERMKSSGCEVNKESLNYVLGQTKQNKTTINDRGLKKILDRGMKEGKIRKHKNWKK